MTAFVPQPDPTADGIHLDIQLSVNTGQYEYDYTHVAPLAILKELPIEDEFSFQWLKAVSERAVAVAANRAEIELDATAKVEIEKRRSLLGKLLDIGDSSVHRIKDLVDEDARSVLDAKGLIIEDLRFDGRFGAPPRAAKTLQDYADLFRKLGLPPIVKDFKDDRVFSAMRVAGPNPIMLQRMKTLDERLSVTNEMLQIAAPGDSLDAALAEGRLFLADYAMLDGAELGTFPNGQKYLYAPLALFVVTGPAKELRPVAIQCKQKPGAENPIFTPNDGYNWLIAKTIVETADGNIHEASTHLARTHLSMEPFVVSTHRKLGPNHPVSLLLMPHFEGTLRINKLAWQFLIADKGGVDKLMGGTIETSRQVAVKGVQSLQIMNDLLPLTFARRGVDDREALPEYPYRDDSLLYWDAIHEWVAAYVRVFYQGDADVQEDAELQAWVRELSAQDGGRLQGLPNNGSLQKIDELIDLVTFVIYTCSVQHAAVNFPQYDYMSYVPNMPLAGYRPAPTSKTGATEADFLAMLPTLDMAELQMELGYMLGTVHYTQLGQYPGSQFRDPRVSALLPQFQKRIADIGQTISERNQSRRPYETLAPGGIPQSINI
jgi:arachidonate 15-lipoxygenase